MRKLFFVFCILSSIYSFGQAVKGKVLDENQQPLPGANIYFDGTTIATIADNNGNFILNLSSKINSVLVISFIGYQTQYINKIDYNKWLMVQKSGRIFYRFFLIAGFKSQMQLYYLRN